MAGDDLLFKTVYQTRDGVFVGTTVADRDPLQPGNWLVPGGCVEDAPPNFEFGKRALLVDGKWVIEDAPAVCVQVDLGGGKGTVGGLLASWNGERIELLSVLPPELAEKQRAIWNGRAWNVEDIKDEEISK